MFVVQIEDRHADTEIHLFTDGGRAVAYAARRVAQYGHRGHEPEPFPGALERGWLFAMTTTAEGDYVTVTERPVDEQTA